MIFYDLVFCIWYCTRLEIRQIHDPGLTLCVANGNGNGNDNGNDNGNGNTRLEIKYVDDPGLTLGGEKLQG